MTTFRDLVFHIRAISEEEENSTPTPYCKARAAAERTYCAQSPTKQLILVVYTLVVLPASTDDLNAR